MPPSRFAYLFERYLEKSCTEEEKAELMELMADPDNRAIAESLIDQLMETSVPAVEIPTEKANAILHSILRAEKPLPAVIKGGHVVWRRYFPAAVAAVLILVAGLFYVLQGKKPGLKRDIAQTKKLPVQIVEDRPVLTLADGTKVMLDTVSNGPIVNVANADIEKDGGQLIFKSNPAVTMVPPSTYNTLSTPKGRQFALVLPDGTKVWLNAASELRFPASFSDTERLVQLSGEAYFEVAKNQKKAFKVDAGNVRVKVTGTHFNVKAYTADNLVQTSLLEGRVTVSRGALANTLRPGQQALLLGQEEQIIVRDVDLDEVMGWKNGLFLFHEADISSIMSEISRWYDVEVTYSGKIPRQKFEGIISRKASLQEVVQILQLSKLKCKLEEKKIIVL